MERLDAGEYVAPISRSAPRNKLLAESVVLHHRTEHGETLVEDLPAMRDEQELVVRARAQPAVVESRDHGLRRAGGRDDQVAGVPPVSLGSEPIKDLLLKRVRPNVNVKGEVF